MQQLRKSFKTLLSTVVEKINDYGSRNFRMFIKMVKKFETFIKKIKFRIFLKKAIDYNV